MIICTVAVGDKYINLSSQLIENFINYGIDVKILTDKPKSYLYGDLYKYDKKIFSFFDKLLFTGKIVEELKCGVLYIDADRLNDVSLPVLKYIKKLKDFTFFDYWQIQIEEDIWEPWIKYTDYKLDYFNAFDDYCLKNNFDISKLNCLWEGIFYFPYLENIDKILYDIELIKPVFEYMSITGIIANNIYAGKLGISEGLALSYVIEKNNLKYNMLKIEDVYNPKLI
jgi:hypothetical protein